MGCVTLILVKLINVQNVALETFEVSELIHNSTEKLLTHNILCPLELDCIEIHQILTDVVFAAPFFLRIVRA